MSQPLRATAMPCSDSDEQLVAKVISGDRAAFDTLYDRYVRRVYSFVYKRMGNRADSEEVVQEIFLKAFCSLASFRGESSFASWVLGIGRRTIANRYKKRQATTVPIDNDVEVSAVNQSAVEPPLTPQDHYEYLERIAMIDQNAKQALTEEQRTLFHLHHLEHRSIAEIATQLGKSQNAVKSNLYRTRKLLLNS